MRKYLVELMIFLLPPLIIGSIGIGIAWHLGYAMPLSEIVRLQSENPRIVYSAETWDNIFHYKLLSIEAQQPAIAILGSSRVRAFSDSLIQNADDFYNMTIPYASLPEAIWILQHINREAMPEIVILSIDPLQQDDEQCNGEDFILPVRTSDFEQIIIGTRNLWQDVLLGNVNIGQLFHNLHVPGSVRIRLGSKALTAENVGYSATGYELDEYVRMERLKYSRNDARSALATRRGIYRSGAEVCDAFFDNIEQFLQLSEEYGVITIGVVLPFAPDVYEAFISESDFAYFPKAINRLEQIFAKKDIRFYDLSDPSIFDADTTYFSDGYHLGSVLSAKVFYTIAQANRELFGLYVDLDELNQLIVSAIHPFALSKDVKTFGDGVNNTEEVDLAKQLISAHKSDQAIALLTQILEADPSDVRAVIHRSRAYIELNQLDEALDDINRAITLSPYSSNAHRLRAKIYHLQGDIDASIADYNYTLELNSMNFDAHGQIGLMYLESGNISDAISRLETYIEEVGDNPAPHYIRALEWAQYLATQDE